MKTFGIVHILLLLLLLLVYQCTHAQQYVVTTKGDSISGEVKPMNFGLEKRVQVTTADKKKKVFSIFEVRHFKFKSDVFRPVKRDQSYEFMKVVKEGYLSIYAFQMEKQTTYDGLYLAKRDGTGIEVPNLSFKKFVSKFLSDCSDISDKIAKGDLTKKNLNDIVDQYNACVNDRTGSESIVVKRPSSAKFTPWSALEDKVKNSDDFESKNDALEMIADIKGKISRGEKVPKFLVDGLKGALADSNLDTELQAAIASLE
jgi:hypothetical protein